jgi:REP element-mobilizing transposase RayT
MPRKLRFEQEGAVYHVLNRGNYRAEVFGTEEAKTAFLQCNLQDLNLLNFSRRTRACLR